MKVLHILFFSLCIHAFETFLVAIAIVMVTNCLYAYSFVVQLLINTLNCINCVNCNIDACMYDVM